MTDNIFKNAMHWDLEQAITKNDLETVKDFLRRGAELGDRGTEGQDMLSLAAACGHREIALLLIEKGADVNKWSRFNTSPLMHAALNGHIGMVHLLLEAGADIDARCDSGATALMLAVNRDKIQTVRLLIQYGADITIRNTYTYGGRSPLEAAIHDNRAEMAQLLREVPAMRQHLAEVKERAAAAEEAHKLWQASHEAATHSQELSAAAAPFYVIRRRLQP